jgi:hypothetical protein
MGPQRPNLVGLICWILILGGFAGLALALKATGSDSFAPAMEKYPYPPLVAEILQFVPRALLVITGILLYERQGWARYLFIAVVPLFLVHAHFTVAQMNTPAMSSTAAQKYAVYKYLLDLGAVLYLASVVYLFLRPIRRYYHPPQYIDE